MRLFKKHNPDFLDGNLRRMNDLEEQARLSVDIITTTINTLTTINEQRVATIQDIDEYIENLNNVRNQLDTKKSHDAIIISNFSKLLST